MEFETISGNTYYYDDEIGIAFPSNPLLNKMISGNPLQTEHISATEKNNEDFLFYNRFLEKLNNVRPKHDGMKRSQPISADEIKPILFRDGLKQIILNITENCNLRCRYCIYSEVYSLSRNRTAKTMDFETAKMALDYYTSLILEGQQYNPVRRPAVSFYGGEPLMNFDLIKKCVLYLESTYPELDFHFSFTTNGTLLTEEKETFLKEHLFFLNISIDGPEKEHDRNRVYPGDKGSFSDVIGNTRRYMKTASDTCTAICVYDFKSNIFELDRFFSQMDIPLLSMISMPGMGDGCRYYDQFSEEDITTFTKTMDDAFRYYLDNYAGDENARSFLAQLFPIDASRNLYTTPMLIPQDQMIIPYSGASIPGRKIFVDCSGNFHICERINEFFPIGNAATGLDFTKIADLMNRYNEHMDSCKSCRIRKACGKCYTSFTRDGSFDYASSVCINDEAMKKMDFSRAFTIGETNPDLLNMVVKNHYSWLSRISPTLGD